MQRDCRGYKGILTACIAALLCGFLWAGSASAAVYDPRLHWNTLSTDHFNIHYPDELTFEAQRLALISEQIHPVMIELLDWTPREPTEVVMVDNTDQANGYATVVPYNRMVLFAARPDFLQSIGDYDDWLRMLFVHEYAHILGLDPRRGYAVVMEKIFGRPGFPFTPFGALAWYFTGPPNAFLPPWFHEGMGVYFESTLTEKGRSNSTYYDMIYRVDVAEGTIPPIDRLGGDFPDWPDFSTRYIYGARLMGMLEQKGGDGTIGELSLGHAGRLPYFIDAPPRRTTGEAYFDLHARMKKGLEAEFAPEIARLRGEGITPVTEVTRNGYFNSHPVWLDGDTLAFIRKSTDHPTELVRHELGGGEQEILALAPGSDSPPFLDGEGRVYYVRLETTRPWAGGLRFFDLYRVGTDGRGEERLTHGARLRYVHGVTGIKALVGVQLDGPRQRLVRLRLGKEGEAPIYETLLEEEGMRYDHPRLSPDGTRVAFSRKTETGSDRLAVLELGSGGVTMLTPEGARAGFPAWSPDGERLTFSWDLNGVFELYEYRVSTGDVHRLTRFLGGGFAPSWSPGGERLAFANYTARGFDVALLDRGDALTAPGSDIAPEPLEPAAVRKEQITPEAAPPGKVEDYGPLPRGLPTFWMPDLTFDNGGAAPGLWTSGHDPLLEHVYFAAGYWSPELSRWYGDLIYINNTSYPTVTLRGSKLPVAYTELLATPTKEYDYWEENRSVGLEVRQNLPWALRSLSVGIEYRWEEVKRLSRTKDDLDGNDALAALPFEGRQNPLILSLSYDDAFPYTTRFTAGPEGGRRLHGEFRWRTEALGSERDSRELVGDWREYFSLPADRWVLAFRGSGGWGRGDETVQSLFQLGGETSEFPLRGYPFRVDRGESVALGSAELRFPLWDPYRGLGDLPLFFGLFHGALFFDVGRTWSNVGSFGEEDWRKGAGAELRMDTVLGYYLPTTLVVGYGHGFDDGGEDRIYVTFLVVY